MGKPFLEYLKPNKINLILMFAGYAIWYISNILIYNPIHALYFPTPDKITPTPLELSIIRTFFDSLVFYIIGSFACWLSYYFKE
jgi:hypothetical protein